MPVGRGIEMNEELKKQIVRMSFASTDNDLAVWKCESCGHNCVVMWEDDIGFELDRCIIFGNRVVDILNGLIPIWNKVI